MAESPAIVITYVPADCGSIFPGKSKASQAFRDADIVTKLRRAGYQSISEYQALESPATYKASSLGSNGVRNEDLNVQVCKDVQRSLVQTLALTGDASLPPFQLILGGECGMSPGVLSAFWQHSTQGDLHKRVGFLYIDADTDLASPDDLNNTGIFAGMNMTNLIRSKGALKSMQQFARPSGEALCDASNTVLFGINMSSPGNKPEHLGYLLDHGYRVISSSSVARQPIEQAMAALRFLEERVDIIVVHLDVDSIDPRMFPLANVPNHTGVEFHQMMQALRVILYSEKVGALVVAEVNPNHDPGLDMTERLTDSIVDILTERRAPRRG
ncbi:hypothetical protein PFICI_07457 [Pestalotiopsis fici W106-1]|uniref:Arginase n=1 Tax=Pestalotiopsis fici (strain W106-1 / CGMCC3.15140) TaxID=1229662 RepID=W3X1C5_PESFW|nr:uncharacterized protein PFICI_07457 [Pestalotiopsis fici W106-1]ETS79928.1 hypothetical protein PFICI_07457 [Pestalotiopsis fici W106-1]